MLLLCIAHMFSSHEWGENVKKGQKHHYGYFDKQVSPTDIDFVSSSFFSYYCYATCCSCYCFFLFHHEKIGRNWEDALQIEQLWSAWFRVIMWDDRICLMGRRKYCRGLGLISGHCNSLILYYHKNIMFFKALGSEAFQIERWGTDDLEWQCDTKEFVFWGKGIILERSSVILLGYLDRYV